MAKSLSLITCNKPPQTFDLTGFVFNKLTVIKFIGLSASNDKYWECQCECGNIKTIAAKHFTTGKTQSCGCFRNSDASRRQMSHGESATTGNTPEYRSYAHAKSRCMSPTNKAFARYGERGIEFRFDSYEQFLNHLGRKPSPKHSLDRIDVDGHYEIGNVRWADDFQQAQNTRRNRYLTLHGVTKCLSEWSRDLNINEATLFERLLTWCNECALTIKHRQGRCKHRNKL